MVAPVVASVSVLCRPYVVAVYAAGYESSAWAAASPECLFEDAQVSSDASSWAYYTCNLESPAELVATVDANSYKVEALGAVDCTWSAVVSLSDDGEGDPKWDISLSCSSLDALP